MIASDLCECNCKATDHNLWKCEHAILAYIRQVAYVRRWSCHGCMRIECTNLVIAYFMQIHAFRIGAWQMPQEAVAVLGCTCQHIDDQCAHTQLMQVKEQYAERDMLQSCHINAANDKPQTTESSHLYQVSRSSTILISCITYRSITLTMLSAYRS